MDISNIGKYILSPELQQILLPTKIIFLAFSWLFLCLIFFGLFKTSWLKEALLQDLVHFFTCKPYARQRMVRTWKKIQAKLKRGSEAEYKLAIIEADRLLDRALKNKGYLGKDLPEKLKKVIAEDLPSREKVLEAHKVRNNIVEDPDFRVSLKQAKEILEIFERALRELEAF